MRENPRIMAARALAEVRRALYAVRRARWRLERSRVADEGLVRRLDALELVLERVALRLETIAATGLHTPMMAALPLALVREASKLIVVPEAEPIMRDLEVILASLLEGTIDEPPSLVMEEASEEAKKILREIEEKLAGRGPVRSPSQADSQAAGPGRVASGPQSEGPLEE